MAIIEFSRDQNVQRIFNRSEITGKRATQQSENVSHLVSSGPLRRGQGTSTQGPGNILGPARILKY